MPKLVLASGSRFRREMLERAGVTFRVQAADVDEPALRDGMLAADPTVSGATIAMALAEAKALQVSRGAPEAWVIGADQVLVCAGRLFSKPPTIEAAGQQLKALRGADTYTANSRCSGSR